jgi:hypothetical protein
MEANNWLRQTEKPLFPELEWNKPERRNQAGRLLIIGGTTHELNAPARAFEYARKNGIGDTKIALPDKTKKFVGATLPEAVFLPSTNSGELSSEGSRELLEYTLWSDTLLLAGENGRNSQTTILFEELLRTFTGNAVITKDAIDILANHPEVLLKRPQTTLVVSFAQLQKLMQNFKNPTPLTFTMDLVKLVEFLVNFSKEHPVGIITQHQSQLLAAANGQVSTTKLAAQQKQWRLHAASLAACYTTWNPEKQFESLTESAFLFAKNSRTEVADSEE